MRLLYRKLKTGAKIACQFGAGFLLRFLINERRYIIWKYRAEKSMNKIQNRGLLLVQTTQGFNMFVDPKDRGVGMELYYSRIHEPFATKLLPCMVRKGETVLECGANIGYYTIQLSQLVGNSGKVIAVEPNPEVSKILKLNLELNRVENVEVYEFALGEKEETIDFYIKAASNLSSMYPEEGEYIEKVPVRVVQIDNLIRTMGYPVHLIRMDAEGHEDKILQGAEVTLKKYLPKMVIEFHKHKMGVERAEKTLWNLQGLGYQIKFAFPRDEDWPWIERQPPVLCLIRIPEFLQSSMWKARNWKTYTLFLEARKDEAHG